MLGLLYTSIVSTSTAAAAGSRLSELDTSSGVSQPAAPASGSNRDIDLRNLPVIGDVKPSAVVGADDRVRTVTDSFPMAAIAYLELSYPGYQSHCTGTFIGPNVLLTAAHCLYSAEDGWVEQARVVPGKDGNYEPCGSAYADWFWVPDGWYEGAEGSYDWGLVRLPTNELANTVGWFQIGVLSTSTLSGPDFNPVISGYPGDKPLGTQWFDSQTAFDSVSATSLEYRIDTYGGNSGSAVWRAADRLIVGVHTTGYTDADGAGLYNAARRIDQYLLNDLIGGCAEIGCEISYAIEGPPPAADHLYTSTLADWGTGYYADGTIYTGQDGSYRLNVAPGDGTYTLAGSYFTGVRQCRCQCRPAAHLERQCSQGLPGHPARAG